MSRLLTFDPARTFDATALTGSYQDVGAVMSSRVLGFTIYNTSDVDVQISFDDGTSNGPIVPAGGTFSSSRFEQTDNITSGGWVVAKGAQIQVKQVTGAGTDGDVIINILRE